MKYRADRSMCGWGSCQATTERAPICEEHLRQAWAIVQAGLNADQQLLAASIPTGTVTPEE